MKLKKFNESVHEDFVEILHETLKKDNKNINGFEFYYDGKSGTIEFSSEQFTIFATPYWEDYLNFPINIINVDGTDILDTKYELRELKTQSDVDNVLIYYYDILNRLTLQLNRISKLIDIIPMILETQRYIEINSEIGDIITYHLYSYDEMSEATLPEQLKIYNIIYEKYPEYFTAKKFNL